LENHKLMRKSKFLFLFVALALVLAACGNLTPPEAAKPFVPTATNANAPVASTQPTEAAVTATPGKPACRVDDSSQLDPALAERFPKVSATDWVQGPEDAYVTILEYSDFQ
jgi:hypothetical protein